MALKWSDPIPFESPIRGFPSIGSNERGDAGIYKVTASRPLSRLQGSSPIVYIGSSGHLAGRLSPRHAVLNRLEELARTLKPKVTFHLEVQTVTLQDVPQGVSTAVWARLLETTELNNYQTCHLELPPLNRRSEGFTVGRVMLAVAEGLKAKPLGIQRILTPTDEPFNALTFLPLILQKGQKRMAQLPQLLWTWPMSWWSEEMPWWQDSSSFGGGNPALEPDALYAFVPQNNSLAKHLTADAKNYDFASEGGVWKTLRLTEAGWGSRVLATSDAKALRDAVQAPANYFK